MSVRKLIPVSSGLQALRRCTYPITITATGANLTHTLEVTLIVRD